MLIGVKGLALQGVLLIKLYCLIYLDIKKFKCDANNIQASLIMLREFTFIELGIDDYPAKTTVQSRY